jgi:RimJ/RimL family protein N-acetyltransferase
VRPCPSRLPDEFSSERAIYPHIRPEIVPLLAERYRIIEQRLMWRMVLEPARFYSAPTGTVRLRAADLGRLQNLYADGQSAGESPDFFTPSIAGRGVFCGVAEGDQLVAAAGAHLVVPEEGVAAIGCVYTCRVRRGSGLASRTTSAVTAELLRLKIGCIALNAHQQNPGAIRVYERLGFTRYCAYREGLGPTEPLIPAFL